MTERETVATTERASGPKTLLIDADVHETFASWGELAPYMPEEWRPRVTQWGFRGPAVAFPYVLSHTVRHYQNRVDWHPRDKSGEREMGAALRGHTEAMGSDLQVLRENLFDEMGVSIAIMDNLQTQVSFMRGEHEFASILAAAYNSWFVENWLDNEPRIAGALTLNIDDVGHSVNEIERLGDHPQIVMVNLPTLVDQQLGDPRYRPIWEAMVRHRLVLTLHHGNGTRTIFDYPRQHIEWKALAPPVAMMCQIGSLIFNGVFDEYPDLKLVAQESGFTWVPAFMSRLDSQYIHFRHEVPWVKERPSDHMRNHVRWCTQPVELMTRRQFLNLIEDIGSEDLLLFASDYPHYDTDIPDEALPKGLNPELEAKIMSLNALQTFPKLAGVVERAGLKVPR